MDSPESFRTTRPKTGVTPSGLDLFAVIDFAIRGSLVELLVAQAFLPGTLSRQAHRSPKSLRHEF
jgi:hypothetical protein